jgi:hypothetical protein
MSAEDAALLKFSESVADFGTWLVIIGVAGEGIEIGLKILRHKLKNENFLGWCNRHEFSIEIWGAIFWLMVVAGLAVEFSGNHDGKIVLDRQNAELYEQGKFAEERAENANKLAADLMQRAEQFRLKADKLEQQIMDTSNNIEKNDVRNWPISEVNAVAWFTVMGTNMCELTNLPTGRKARMSLWKNEREGFSLDNLEAANGDISEYFPMIIFGTRDRHIYRAALHSFNFLTAEGNKPPPVKTIDDVHLVHVDLNFLPRDSQISSGRVILTVNNVTKFFDVPNQNDTNSNMGRQNDFQCWFVGTNGVQTHEKVFLYLRN